MGCMARTSTTTLQRNALVDCNLCFVTVKQMVQDIKSKLNIQAYWVPEGIDKNEYCGDKNLKERDVDVYEMGRGMPRYHELLLQGNKSWNYKKNFYITGLIQMVR